MSSHSLNLKAPVNEAFSEIQQSIGVSEFKIKSIVPNGSIIAEGSREFSWAIVIILVIILWPAALVYYFTRQRSNITIIISADNETGSKVTITSSGKDGDGVMQLITETLELLEPALQKNFSEKTQDGTQFWVCPNCGNNTEMKDKRQYCSSCKIYLSI